MSDKYELQHFTIPSTSVTLGYRLSHTLNHSLQTIVMFHSFLMDSRLYLSQFKDPRYSQFNLIAIDAHGHGGTSGRESQEDGFTYWDTARDALVLLDGLGVNTFYGLGTSQGGFIVLRMALLAPIRVNGLILLGTSPYAESELNKRKFKEVRDAWISSPDGIPSSDAVKAKAVSFGGKERVGEAVFNKIKEMWVTRYKGAEGYDPPLHCLSYRDGIEDRLHEITAPVLVMHGSDDLVYPLADCTWPSLLNNLYAFEKVERGVHYLSFTEPGEEICALRVPEFMQQTFPS